jgi:hypothetical protein
MQLIIRDLFKPIAADFTKTYKDTLRFMKSFTRASDLTQAGLKVDRVIVAEIIDDR